MDKILDINRIRRQLDDADIYEDYDGNKIQTIYLGDIRNMTPSGKVYTPFAHSILEQCERCRGSGEIKNKHGKKKKHNKILRKFKLMWPTVENVELVEKLIKQQQWWKPYKTCPECHGLRSLEARRDQDFWEQLQLELDEVDAWYHSSEGDGCDVMVSREAIKREDNHQQQ